ncbi:hypothetical protein [Mucilaginibacter rubeus]|uniref:Uncharacterized protein n=1 Tax=Mucilaginibacter rubeus TaxID=2027860 RepID=A0A5C1I718_9SPHI|nr:hypothetical protein [Mucilaginibacter rubeus]QEM13819.1 hypothetical protein DEO27_028645 [Mucilaginibacter rubeus]
MNNQKKKPRTGVLIVIYVLAIAAIFISSVFMPASSEKIPPGFYLHLAVVIGCLFFLCRDLYRLIKRDKAYVWPVVVHVIALIILAAPLVVLMT